MGDGRLLGWAEVSLGSRRCVLTRRRMSMGGRVRPVGDVGGIRRARRLNLNVRRGSDLQLSVVHSVRRLIWLRSRSVGRNSTRRG